MEDITKKQESIENYKVGDMVRWVSRQNAMAKIREIDPEKKTAKLSLYMFGVVKESGAEVPFDDLIMATGQEKETLKNFYEKGTLPE